MTIISRFLENWNKYWSERAFHFLLQWKFGPKSIAEQGMEIAFSSNQSKSSPMTIGLGDKSGSANISPLDATCTVWIF